VKIFSYGTLQVGFSNHRVMQEAQGKFLGKGYLTDRHIFFTSPGSFPAVSEGKGVVHGEVWEISENKIQTPWGDSIYPIQILDRLEGFNPKRPKESNMYNRQRVVVTMNDGRKVWVSYYHWNGVTLPHLRIKSGNWAKEYKNYHSRLQR